METRQVWVETDLEPDDVLALMLPPLSSAQYYVVGEGDPKIKYNRMKRYCQLLKNEKAMVIEGLGSENEFPKDGTEFENLAQDRCDEDYFQHFETFALSESPIMFSLKPMRELVREFSKNEDRVKELVQRIDLYIYGGFNFRLVAEKILALLSHFKRVFVYESFYATGEENSMTKANFPRLYTYFQNSSEYLQTSSEYLQTLKRLTSIWNCHLRDKCLENVKKAKDAERKRRNQKIIDNISGNEDFQFVIADFALAAIFDLVKAEPVENLHFDENGYSKFDLSPSPPENKIHFYKDIHLQLIEDAILQKLGQPLIS
jgi:hypothetical protein